MVTNIFTMPTTLSTSHYFLSNFFVKFAFYLISFFFILRGNESWIHENLLLKEVKVQGQNSSNAKIHLTAAPQVIDEDEARIDVALYKTGGLIFRLSSKTKKFQLAILLNNNSSSFLHLKFALRVFMRNHAEPNATTYNDALESLLDANQGNDSEHIGVPRPWLWRKHELVALMSLRHDRESQLHPAFLSREVRRQTFQRHPHLCERLASIADIEYDRRIVSEENNDDMFNYRWKWDIPKGLYQSSQSTDQISLSESAKNNIAKEMGISEDSLPEHCETTSMEETYGKLTIKSTLLCYFIPPELDLSFSKRNGKPPSRHEFDSDQDFQGDSAWCDVDTILQDLESPMGNCSKYWAIPSSMRLLPTTFASRLRSAVSTIF